MSNENQLKSNTEVCEENSYNYIPGKEMPQAFQCGGVANSGKVMTVDTDGYIRPKTGGGGTTVVANPTLAGTESDLTGLQVGTTKYKVPTGSGTSYTATNGIAIDTTTNEIGLDTTATTTPEIASLKVLGELTGSGAYFGDGDFEWYSDDTTATSPTHRYFDLYTNSDLDDPIVQIGYETSYNDWDTAIYHRLDLQNCNLILPSMELTGTSGSLTADEYEKLQKHYSYITLENNKYYYCGVTYDTTDPDIVRTITYQCANVGKIVCECVGTGTYTYTWTFTADSGSSTYVEKTYSELKALRDASNLVPGTYYRITDYVATTNGKGAGTANYTQSANHPFDLVVYATANNKLQENCYAIQHSGDTYFANSELLSWDVWYCLDNDTARFEWADNTNGKGVIYYLKDEFSNSAWYDFKGIQVKNPTTNDRFYYLFDNSGADSSMSSSTAFPNVYANNFGFFISFHKYSIGCNIFSGNQFYYNTIGNDFYFNTIENYFNYNTIGNQFYSNTIGTNFYFNTIGNYSNSNTIGNYFNSNTIGNDFYFNTIGNYFNSNTIGNQFYYNTIGNQFYSNTIGNDFSHNTIGAVSTDIYYQYNNFGDGIIYVDITDYGTSSVYKSGITLPSGLVGTSSSRKTISSLTNSTTYYINQQQIS